MSDLRRYSDEITTVRSTRNPGAAVNYSVLYTNDKAYVSVTQLTNETCAAQLLP